jgi:4-amino-4-deoxy-L-arabinose transferase-like glycosyltransferase
MYSMLKNKHVLLIFLFLTGATLTAFLQVNQCDFISYDDPVYVTENIHILHGITIQAIRWAFSIGYASNWHPLTWMSHMLDVQLFGLNPQWHHLTNLLFHIANTLLLFFVFHRMTKAPWKSALVASLFALHPLHVESVACVSERKDVLSTFFWMLTMAAYIHYVEHRRLKNYMAVLIFFALGLMAKPMLVTLPFVLLLLDYWPLRRLWGLGGQGSMEQVARSERQNTSLGREPLSANKRKRKSAKKPTDRGITQSSVLSPQSFALRPQSSALLLLLREKVPLLALASL